MKGIAQDNISANRFDITWQHAFYGTISTHWHKSRRLHIAMIEMNRTTACARDTAGRFV